jgi:WD40 repeat protein
VHRDAVKSVAFSPDGKILATGGRDSVLVFWDMDPESWTRKLCERVGRNFTDVEWQQYFSGEEYQKTCDQWPPGD